ncbi:WD40 repeat-like protein [Dendrothele bispora CBS 962.96]|uniref:WD40 repeat-like protein n=1 Tax=Dendrothele bispora (strain CBS 962.96) TaxID=1314807 RepID=A0A4S8LGG7_DENBC|nr:WD40 repeat-like protein [Dendrothele bispora CBS 962.96]
MEEQLKILIEKLDLISNQVNKKLSRMEKVHRVVQPDYISKEIDGYFEAVNNAFDNCKTEVLLIVEGKLTLILKGLDMDRLNYSPQAFYDTDNGVEFARKECTAGTRQQILDDIEAWVEDSTASLGYWICGMAGTGKSTIAKSVCIRLKKKEHLAASFFCSRQISECKDYRRIIPTIAYQIARYSHTFAQELQKVLVADRDISTKSPADQLKMLIVGPWAATTRTEEFGNITPVIVVDALDECEHVSLVLKELIPAIQNQKIPRLRFLFTSRPEKNIYDHLTNVINPLPPKSQVQEFELHNVEEAVVREDIIMYIKEELSTLRLDIEKHEVESIANKAGKLFIYAATVIRYITGVKGLGKTRLSDIMSEGHIPRDKKETESLDNLYSDILANVLSPLTLEESELTVKILYTSLFVGMRVSCSMLSELLEIDLKFVESTISSLQSVLYVDKRDQAIYTFHASFLDYISSKMRAQSLYCDITKHHAYLTNICLDLMNKQLKFNICDLPSSFLADRDVPNIDQTIEEEINEGLWYSCNFWGFHLTNANLHEGEVIETFEKFMDEKILFWIEAMNLLGRLPWIGVMNIQNFQYLGTQISQLKTVMNAFSLSEVKEMTPHFYLSIIPWWPVEISVVKNLKNVLKVIKKTGHGTIGFWETPGTVKCISVSPDGQRLVTALYNGTCIVWSTVTGTQINIFEEHEDTVNSVVFFADGDKTVSGSDDNTIRIWDSKTCAAIGNSLLGHEDSVLSVAISPDEYLVASGSEDHTIRIWDVKTGVTVGDPLNGHSDSVNSVAFSPDGQQVVSGSRDRTIRVWNAKTRNLIGNPLHGHEDAVLSVSFSPNGKYIVSGSGDGTVRIWDTKIWSEIMKLDGHTDCVKSVKFSLDNERIISGSDDETIRIWNAKTGGLIGNPLQGHSDWVNSVAFSPDGNLLFSGSDDMTVRIWDAKTGAAAGNSLPGHEDVVCAVAFSPDGAYIASGSDDGTIRLWDAQTGVAIGIPFLDHENTVSSVAFSADGHQIVSGSRDTTVRIWDFKIGLQIGTLIHPDAVSSVAFSLDGTTITSGSDDGMIRIWDVNTKALLQTLSGHEAGVWSAVFSPDGSKIVSGSPDESVRLWDAKTGDMIGDPLLGHEGTVFCVAFSPDGKSIASASSDETIIIWDAETRTAVGNPLQGHEDEINSVAFSSDGNRIISGSDDRTVRIWDARSGAALGSPLKGHYHSVMSVAFYPDGSRIVSGSLDNSIRIWDVKNRTSIQYGHEMVTFSMEDSHESVTMGNVSSNQTGNVQLNAPDSQTLNPDIHWTLSDDGWIYFPNNKEGIVWIPPQFRENFWSEETLLIISKAGYNKVSFRDCVYGENWAQCYSQK